MIAQVALLALIAAVTSHAPDSWEVEQFHRAVTGRSTTHEFVLVTVVDERTGERYPICMPANHFLGALQREHDSDNDDAREQRLMSLALGTSDRVFTFRKPSVLDELVPPYSPEMLDEARRLAAPMDSAQLVREVEAIHEPGVLRQWMSEGSVEQQDARIAAMACALLERGVPTAIGCFSGLRVARDMQSPTLELRPTRDASPPGP